MNISDYFKAKPSKPIEALIEEILKDNGPTINIQYLQSRNETDALVENILGGKDDKLPIENILGF